MKFAAKGDPLARALGMEKAPALPEVEKPHIPLKRITSRGRWYDYEAVRDELAAYIKKENGCKGRSLESIAGDFNVAKGSFRANITKLGIEYELKADPRQHITRKTDELCIQAFRRYLELKKYMAVAREFDISDSTAKYWIAIGEQLVGKVETAKAMYAANYGVQAIARRINEAPHLVAQWVKAK